MLTPIQWAVIMLAATAAIYTVTAVAYHYATRPGMVLVFIGYVIANLGMIWDVIKTGQH